MWSVLKSNLTMDTKSLENIHLNDTTPDLEKNPRQNFHPRKEKNARVRDSLMDYGETQGDRALYQPTLWWFTSTAFPLIAGTFGPLANLFSTCALVKPWRVKIITRYNVPDPSWLITLNAFSLLFAIIANVTLLFGFARRIRYSIAQPLTISLWYLSFIFLIIPIALTRLPRFSPSTNPTLEYSESFFYAVIAAVLHFTISTLLLFSLLGSSRFFRAYPPTFALLTRSQRTLMLQTISFSLYLALGGGVFSAAEGWSFTDGVYWADYTVLTVGLGTDFPLKTTLGRMLLIPYAPLGIALVGLVVRSVMGLVMERAKEKVVMRHLGKERDKWMDNINQNLQGNGKDEATGLKLIAQRPKLLLFCWHYNRVKKSQEIPRALAYARSTQPQDQHGRWHHAEFELMRHIQITGEQSARYIALVGSFLAFLVVWIGGSLVFLATEHKQKWTYPESLYFTYTTLLTIGYGDFYPASSAGRPFFVVWSLIAVPTMTVLVGHLGETVIRGVQELTDLAGRKTVLPEYQEEVARKHVKDDQTPSDSDKVTKSRPRNSDPPSFSTIRPLPVRNHPDLSLVPSPGEGQEAGAASQVKSCFEHRVKDRPPASDYQNPPQSNGGNSGPTCPVQTEVTLLARAISKLAKDVCEQPPKKYGWEEWVDWLKILGDEVVSGRKAMELDQKIEVTMSLPATAAILDTQSEHPHSSSDPDIRQHHREYLRHYHSNAHVKKEDGWYWTWLHDKGPLFSGQTETEWILSRLCNRLEDLMKDDLPV